MTDCHCQEFARSFRFLQHSCPLIKDVNSILCNAKGSSYVSHGVNRSGSDSEAWKQQPIWCKPSLNYEQNITKYQLVPADNRSLSVSKLQALQWAACSNTHTAFYFFMRCRFKKPFTAQRRYSSSSHDSSLVTIRTERKSLSDFPLSFAELRWQMTVVLVSEDQL